MSIHLGRQSYVGTTDMEKCIRPEVWTLDHSVKFVWLWLKFTWLPSRSLCGLWLAYWLRLVFLVLGLFWAGQMSTVCRFRSLFNFIHIRHVWVFVVVFFIFFFFKTCCKYCTLYERSRINTVKSSHYIWQYMSSIMCHWRLIIMPINWTIKLDQTTVSLLFLPCVHLI